MIISVNIQNKDLERISNIISEGKASNIQDFIRYSILNQLEIEESFEDKESIVSQPNFQAHQKSNDVTKIKKSVTRRKLVEIDLSAHEIQNITPINIDNIKERTIYPIWSMKNRYFPVKYVLRILQNLLKERKNGVDFNTLNEEISNTVLDFRKKLDRIDKISENKRGNRIAAGFPNGKKPQSMTRFLRNFVISISPDGKKISGMPYDFGFIDVQDGIISITQHGNKFSNIQSPIIDQPIDSVGKRSNPFAVDELEFLIDYIMTHTNSESSLMKYFLSRMQNKDFTPDELNEMMMTFLNQEYRDDKSYTIDIARSLRVGLTSRMVELRLIENNRLNGRSSYLLTPRGRQHMGGG